MGKLLDNFKQFFENASKEELEELWEKNKKHNEYGPVVTDYLDKVENEKIMDMEKYTIYCNTIQTRKAIELGAPIEAKPLMESPNSWTGKAYIIEGNICALPPTAEQMIGWLETQGIYIQIEPCYRSSCTSYFFSNRFEKSYISEYLIRNTREEATHAAIDAALDYLFYLRKNKQKEK